MTDRILALLLCSAALFFGTVPAGAQKTQTVAEIEKYGVYPIAYRELIQRWLEEQLIDPSSAQIEWVEEPRPVVITGRDGQPFAGFVVDFKVNSRNKFGMYTGKQARRVYIRNGQVVGGGRATR